MRILAQVFFALILILGDAEFASAETGCWRGCTSRNYSTKHCAERCGISNYQEQYVCMNYCRGRGGSSSTCNLLCGASSDEPTEPGYSPPRNPPVNPPEDTKPDDGRGGREGAQCRMSSDCPTFSSCERGWCVRSGGEGAQCRMSSDCPTFSSCENGWCVRGNGEGAECRMSSDCPTFSSCERGWCVR
jgi:hypothetical protein